MRNTFINSILAETEKRSDLFIISGDAGLGVFDEFKLKYPDRFLNLGVAEQNMISMAAGLALTGYKVVVYNIIPFVLYRCFEQVRNDICYQKLPVVLVGIGSGITYAPQGMTHYSVEDIGLAQTLPNLTVISPIDPIEAELAAEYSMKADGPVYVRLAKRGEPVIHTGRDFDLTVPQVVKSGEVAAIVFHGSVSAEVLSAYEELKRDGIKPALISIPVVQPLNERALDAALRPYKYVISVEEHFVNTGFGSILMKYHFSQKPAWRLINLGLPFKFIHEIKDTAGLREHYGISASTIVRTVKELMEVKR